MPKVVFVGDSNSGKTTLLKRYIKNTYSEDSEPTISASFFTKKIQINDQDIKLEIWEAGGLPRYRSVSPGYIENTSAIVINIALPQIDYNQEVYLKEIKEQIAGWVKTCNVFSQGTPFILALNKADLLQDIAIPYAEIEQLAKKHGIKSVVVTSAKNDKDVNELFEQTAKLTLQHDAEQQKRLQEKAQKTTANQDLSKSGKKESLFNKLNNTNTLLVLLLLALVIATILLILFPPVGLAAYVATGISAAGLSGLSIGVVAAIAGAAVALLGLTLFGLAKATALLFARDKRVTIEMEDFSKPADDKKPLLSQEQTSVPGGTEFTDMPGTGHLLNRKQASTTTATHLATSDNQLIPS